MITGGYLKDIPLPHRRKWPGADRQREVHAQIVRYLGAMGQHYYASMKQENNPIWNMSDAFDSPGKSAGWTDCWDDEEGEGAFLFTRKFDSHIEATGWIAQMMRKQFPDHKLVMDDYSDEYYQREGD